MAFPEFGGLFRTDLAPGGDYWMLLPDWHGADLTFLRGGTPIAGAAPTVAGTAKRGKTLTASIGSWPQGTKVTYQWLRGSCRSAAPTARPTS